MKFKVGDKVICKHGAESEPAWALPLEANKVYLVSYIDNLGRCQLERRGYALYNADRLLLADATPLERVIFTYP